MLGHGGHHPNGERIGLGHIGTHKLGPRISQGKDESHIPGESVELGNEQHPAPLLTAGDGLEQLGPVVFLTRLDIGKLGDEHAPVVEVGIDARPLGAQAEAAGTLSLGGDPVVGYVLTSGG